MDEIGEVKDLDYYRLVIPKEIDWDVFSGCDPAPLHALTLSVQEKHALIGKPSQTQTSPLSDLQILVKQSKKNIIDPVLEQCAAYTAQLSLEDEDEGYGDAGDTRLKEYWKVEMDREREREKIRELKKKKIYAGLSLPGTTVGGVFVRRDVEDESAVVDVTATEEGSRTGTGKVKETNFARSLVKGEREDTHIDLDFPSFEADSNMVRTKTRPTRARRATTKQHILQEEKASSSKKRKRTGSTATSTTPTPTSVLAPSTSASAPASPMDIDDNDNEDSVNADPPASGKRAARGGNSNKPKPETYKQAWTESEQNLLEQLLDKIPDGEKNRWQKISRAMKGRRTPRQVASRVQKYFEKLKKYGIDIGGSGGRGGGRSRVS
ncbi:hypothetical protein AX15_003605 [Amanita polypyramis BW_CC]|nr:hypothetical protein AX15_003605 [Amanita polypyramis BW_CC]